MLLSSWVVVDQLPACCEPCDLVRVSASYDAHCLTNKTHSGLTRTGIRLHQLKGRVCFQSIPKAEDSARDAAGGHPPSEECHLKPNCQSRSLSAVRYSAHVVIVPNARNPLARLW